MSGDNFCETMLLSIGSQNLDQLNASQHIYQGVYKPTKPWIPHLLDLLHHTI